MVIDELFAKKIGGLDQWISIRANDDSKPVLLMLHGGPGTPSMSLFRKYNRPLRDHFVMVTWDQRGTGRSFSKDIPVESMTMEQLIRDAHEVTEYAKDRFTTDRVFILGHSWGATLAMQVIDRKPDDYLAYFGVSQFVNADRNEAESYEFALRKAIEHEDKRSLRVLEKIGRPIEGFYAGGLKDTRAQKAIVGKYKGDVVASNAMLRLAMDMARSQEYGFWRFGKALQGITFSLETLGQSLRGIDYFTQIPEVHIPVYFFSGRYDYLTPQSILKEYFEVLAAPKKELHVFENSAHSPLFEEAESFNRLIIEISRGF
jgi:proline iminopeptidase